MKLSWFQTFEMPIKIPFRFNLVLKTQHHTYKMYIWLLLKKKTAILKFVNVTYTIHIRPNQIDFAICCLQMTFYWLVFERQLRSLISRMHKYNYEQIVFSILLSFSIHSVVWSKKNVHFIVFFLVTKKESNKFSEVRQKQIF